MIHDIKNSEEDDSLQNKQQQIQLTKIFFAKTETKNSNTTKQEKSRSSNHPWDH